jgi:hypothetical protein
MAKQLNIILTDDEFAKLVEMRRKHPHLPTVQGFARALFRKVIGGKMTDKQIANVPVGK